MPSTPRSDWQISAFHLNDGSHNKFYAVRIDYTGTEQPFQVVASWGKATASRAQSSQEKGTFRTLSSAQRHMETLIHEKVSKGYVNIESRTYSGFLSLEKVMQMIDTTRILGYAATEESRPQPQTTLTRVARSTSTEVEHARATRSINL